MRFSYNTYTKFTPIGGMPKRAFVLQVLLVRKNDLSKAYLKYDTEYMHNGERKYYNLPDESMIVLPILATEKGLLFTTLRKPETYDYYKEKEGSWIEIILS